MPAIDDAVTARPADDRSRQSPEARGPSDVRLRTPLRATDVAIRAGIVVLALSTAYIHSTLGGLLFTLNAVGYVVAAVAMVIPLALAVRFRWVVRLGLIGYAATTIVGWAIQGPYYQTAYIAKAIEVALIVLVAVDFARMDGNPVTVVKRELASFTALVAAAAAPPAPASSSDPRRSTTPDPPHATRSPYRMKRLVLGLGLVGPGRRHRRLFRIRRGRRPVRRPGRVAPPGAVIDRRQGHRLHAVRGHGPGRTSPSRSSWTTRKPPRTTSTSRTPRGRGVQGRDRHEAADRPTPSSRSQPGPTRSSARSTRT